MNDDYVLRVVESIGRFAGKLFFQQESNDLENIQLESMSKQDVLPILLKRLVLERKYNEAENILFEELNKNFCDDLINIGENFYNMLLTKSDEELTEGNFSKEEVAQGLKDLNKHCKNRKEV